MKSRRVLILLVGVGALVVITILAVLPGKDDEEPIYEGKRLGTWMDVCTPGPSDAEYKAALITLTNVVQSVGTNALSYLVKWIQYKPLPSWYEKFQDWVEELSQG